MKEINELPTDKQTPSWLQLVHWIRDPVNYLEKMAESYGETFVARFPGCQPYVHTSNPHWIREIFALGYDQVEVGTNNRSVRALVGNNSLLILDDKRHKYHRRFLMPPFHKERIHHYAQLIREITEQLAMSWSIGKPLIARTAMQNIALQVIMQAVFGLSQGERYEEFKSLLQSLLDSIDSPFGYISLLLKPLQTDWGSWSFWGKLVRKQEQIHSFLQSEIEQRRQQIDDSQKDILSLLLQMRDDRGNPLNDLEIREELITLLFAGQESTSTALSWGLYWIHRDPKIEAKLSQELDTLSNQLESLNIPYLNAVCCETLRICPPAPISGLRTTKVPLQLMGYNLPKGTALIPCIYLAHQREDLYPNPKQFEPERFLTRQYNSTEYFPFGGGNRRCIGYALAQMELKLVLGTLLTKYKFQLVDQQLVKPRRRGIILSPSDGIRIIPMAKAKRTE